MATFLPLLFATGPYSVLLQPIQKLYRPMINYVDCLSLCSGFGKDDPANLVYTLFFLYMQQCPDVVSSCLRYDVCAVKLGEFVHAAPDQSSVALNGVNASATAPDQSSVALNGVNASATAAKIEVEGFFIDKLAEILDTYQTVPNPGPAPACRAKVQESHKRCVTFIHWGPPPPVFLCCLLHK